MPRTGPEHGAKPDHGESSYKGFGRLKGRRALVTGADSGIGRTVAIALAREGADVVLESEDKDAQEVMGYVTESGVEDVARPGDISQEVFCHQLIESTVHALGGIDILVNVAGKQTAVANQVVEKGIRVNAVAPGPVWTPLKPSGGQPQEKLMDFGSEVPMKSPGQPAELAPVYVLLASQESSFVTGEAYGVTGGNHLS